MRRIPVTLIVHTFQEIYDDAWSDDSIKFFVEENHCLTNVISDIQKDIDASPGTCGLCAHAEARIGHIPFKSIPRE